MKASELQGSVCPCPNPQEKGDAAVLRQAGKGVCCASGKTVRVKTLGIESEAERRLQSLQEECLDRAFHISMDRVNYRASDRGQVQEEQEEVLQELKDLENPEASPYRISGFPGPLQTVQSPSEQCQLPLVWWDVDPSGYSHMKTHHSRLWLWRGAL